MRWAVGPPPTAVSEAEWAPVATALKPRTIASAPSAWGRTSRPKLAEGWLQLIPLGESQEAGAHRFPVRLPPTAISPVPNGARPVIR